MEAQSGRRKALKNWAFKIKWFTFKIPWFTKIESSKTRRRDTEKGWGREELEDGSGKIVREAKVKDDKIRVRNGEENRWEGKNKRERIGQVVFGES
jgi:hypothetical protein